MHMVRGEMKYSGESPNDLEPESVTYSFKEEEKEELFAVCKECHTSQLLGHL